MKPAIAGQARGTSLATIVHASGSNTIENPNKIGCKPKFPCKLCKGYHLTYLCPVLSDARRVWSQSQGSFATTVPESC